MARAVYFADFGEGFIQVVGQWVGGGEDLAAGFVAVAAGGANKFLDTPTCLVLDPVMR